MVVTQEMKEYFLLRTRAHLFLVNKYHNKITKLKIYLINNELLDKERDEHDQFKFHEPEYSPYLFITWNYYCKRKNIPFELSQDIKDKMHEATFHHIKNHKYYLEFWDTKQDHNFNAYSKGSELLSDLLVECYEALETIKETIKMVPHDSLDGKFLDIANSANEWAKIEVQYE